MKKLVSWHEGCLKNAKTYYNSALENAERNMDEAIKGLVVCAVYEQQIQEAKKRGVDAFDRDKFSKKGGDK